MNQGNQRIVVDDLLSFVSHKRHLVSQRLMVQRLEGFYSVCIGQTSLKKLLSSLTRKKRYIKILGQLEEPNVFQAILSFLGLIDESDLPTFVCKDLGNIPTIREPEKQNETKEILDEHVSMKHQINEFHSIIHELKNKLVQGEVQPSSNEITLSLVIDMEEKIKYFGSRALNGVRDISTLSSPSSTDESLEIIIVPHNNSRKPKLIDIVREDEFSSLNSNHISFNPESINTVDLCSDDLSQNSDEMNSYSDDFQQLLNNEVSEEFEPISSTLIQSSKSYFGPDDQKVLNYRITGRKRAGKYLNKKKFTCKECKIKIFGIKPYDEHIKKCHSDSYRCPICTVNYTSSAWLDHFKDCREANVISSNELYCDICDSVYANSTLLKFHQSLHEEDRPFVCSHCEFRFTTEKLFRSHQKSHLGSPSYVKCFFCPLLFLSIRIEEHIRSHTGERPYECELCSIKIRTRSRFIKHMHIHNRPVTKKYTCDDCTQCFKSYKLVRDHIITVHNNDYPLKCSECLRGFPNGRSLSAHHQEEHLEIVGNYPCPFSNCNYKAKTAGILGAHLNVHTGSRPFKCKYCDFAAGHKSYLTWHIRSYHEVANYGT